MFYECKEQKIIYNDIERPFRYIKCDDAMIDALYALDFPHHYYYETVGEALSVLKSVCPIVDITTGTYNGTDRNGHFGNTNSMYNDGKYYYVGNFYGTQGEIINMNGKVYNSDRSKYVDFTTISSDNLYDADTDEHLSGSYSLFSDAELFGSIGGSTLFIGDTNLIFASVLYAGDNGYKIETSLIYPIENHIFTNFFDGIDPSDYEKSDDPYSDSNADDGGGHGTPDWNSDPITEKALPPDFYGAGGLVSVYTPTAQELRAFSNYIWGDTFDLNNFKKIVNNPFDLVLGLSYIPLLSIAGGTRAINVGNIVDTGLTMTYPQQENYRHDFGTITLDEDERAFIDYSPYTRVSIHLPFIGTQAIDIDLLRRNTSFNNTSFKLIYKYNIVNGCVTAYLYTTNQKVLYEWAGNVSTPIPVASNDYTNAISSFVHLASSAVSGAVAGGMIGGPAGAAVGAGATALSSGLDAIATLKPTITTTGAIGGGNAPLTSTNDAFLLIEQPKLSIANNHGRYLGFPRNQSDTIKNCKGYNEIANARINSKWATDTEKAEILEILKGGYIYGMSYGTVIDAPTLPDDLSDEFTIALYRNNSSDNRIDKSCELVNDYVHCNIKENCSVITPSVTMNVGNANAIKANYCYIPAFKRFYYITNKTCVRGNLWQFDLRSDVLMSFRNEIIDNTAVFKKCENKWNLYLNDGSLQIDSRPRIKVKKFPSSITNDGTYVLLMAGS